MDHYKVLGLNKNATKAEIKQAFRKLALQFHPDKHSHSPKVARDTALLKFKQASEAYEVLIDDHKRAQYNHKFSGGGTANGYANGYNHPYYNARGNGTSYRPRYSYASASRWPFDFDATLRFLTSRVFLLNLTFASVLLAGAAVIDTSGETLWKMHNSGKSFEDAVDSIEKKKRREDPG